MKIYNIGIRETLYKEVSIVAETEEEALDKIKEMYDDVEIVLDSDYLSDYPEILVVNTNSLENFIDIYENSPDFILEEKEKNNFLTEEMCISIIKDCSKNIGLIPEKKLTKKICMAAVQNWGGALEYVPEEFKTPEICMAAVKNDGLALRFVPDKLLTKEIIDQVDEKYQDKAYKRLEDHNKTKLPKIKSKSKEEDLER